MRSKALPLALVVVALTSGCIDIGPRPVDRTGIARETATPAVRRSIPGLRIMDPNRKSATVEPGSKPGKKWTLVLTGSSIVGVEETSIPYGGSRASFVFTLDAKGRETFAEWSRRNAGRQIAFVLGDEVLYAPLVVTEIPDGRGSITPATAEQARRLRAAIVTP